ncbi:MAG: EAL domain-containing protein [Acidimicrobiales bacterium]
MATDEQLSDVLGEFARTMLTDFPIQAILDHLVKRIVDVLPVTAAGVTLISPGADPRYVAASDESALRFEKLQTELGEGPCLVAYQTGEAVSVADLHDECRFPKLAPRALEAGLAAVFTFPLRHGDEQLGALDLYRSTPGALGASSMSAAQTLADVAAAYLLNARRRGDLQDALDLARDVAVHDGLTGLPNRMLLLDRLDHALARRIRRPSNTAVLFVDIDRFKWLNDRLGHEGGDRVLIEVAARLRAAVRPADTVARFGGDEFVVLCEGADDEFQAAALAERLVEANAAPLTIGGHEITATVCIGISFAAATGDENSNALLRDADAAMYRAKGEGGGSYVIFDAGMHSRARERQDTESALRRAIARRELVVFYQPAVDLTTNEVMGVEALVRWEHPERGLVAPDQFLPVAEATGLIMPLGAFVLEEACRQLAAWRRSPTPLALSLSVNLSARQLLTADLSEGVRRVLAESGLEPGSLCLELTESMLLEDVDASVKALDALKAIGVLVAIDDFGTGYASLTYLKRFPVDILKIDKSFVARLADDRHDRVIVSSIVDLAHSFGLQTVGEGVETADQLDLLRALECAAAQGYYWSPALPPDDLVRWMEGASVMAPPGNVPRGPAAGVLIVEDDTSLRNMLRLLLTGAPGYCVVGEADDGREAVALAARHQPDLVLLDLAMPGMGGLEALPLILGVAPHTKIVVLTGLEAAGMADIVRSQGAAGLFEKGLDPMELLTRLSSILRRSPIAPPPPTLSGHVSDNRTARTP